MTAEVAILNREAVAMAADSAATMSTGTGQKILSSANKVFALSKYRPVGIMIYGSALFMNIPWETIIKSYRKKLGNTPFDTLKEYAGGFIEFVKNSTSLFPEAVQEHFIIGSIYSFFDHVRNEITTAIEGEIESGNAITEKEILKLNEKIISRYLSEWKNGESNVSDLEKHHTELKNKYKKNIEKAVKDVFEKLPLNPKSKQMLVDIAAYLFLTFPDEIQSGGLSGIVVCGFGETELFPSLVSYSVEGMANNILKYKEDNYSKIDFDKTAIIQPFAQQEMVVNFIEGISPLHEQLYDQILSQTIENYPKIIIENIAPKLKEDEKNELIKKIKKISSENLKKGLKKIDEIKKNHYIDPILHVVTFLSKNELAEMAESLVNLTCLRKKISMDDETVGGLIDVAVISKGDGLIWIKRKHYFKPELNKHFFINYLDK